MLRKFLLLCTLARPVKTSRKFRRLFWMFAVIRFGQFCQCFGNFFCALSHKEGEGSKNIKKAASMFSVYPLHRSDCVKKCLLGQISLLVVCQTKFGRFADACNILLPLSENIRKAASKFSVVGIVSICCCLVRKIWNFPAEFSNRVSLSFPGDEAIFLY